MRFLQRFQIFFAGAGSVLRRFPHVLICSAAFSLTLILKEKGSVENGMLSRLAMVFCLGIPAYFGLAVFDERYTMKRSTIYLLHGVLAGSLALYYFILPDEFNGIDQWRFAFLIILLHLAVSFAPFLVNNEANAFWQYNRLLFFRFLSTALFSVVLFSGLLLAAYSCKRLLNFNFPDQVFLYIFYCICTFNTWVFLAGIPEKVELLENRYDYPPALKIFAGYVLIPILLIFAVILYTYSIKSLLTGSLFRDDVLSLVSAFLVAALLTYLFLWPVRNGDKIWITRFNNYLFLFILPLMILTIASVLLQMKHEFASVPHLAVLSFCLALSLISILFILSKRKNIRIIPMILFGAVLIGGFSPISIFEISRKKTLGDILDKLETSGRLKEGKIFITGDNLHKADSTLYDEMLYVNNMFGFNIFNPLLDEQLKLKLNSTNERENIFRLMDTLDINPSYFVYERNYLSAIHEDPLEITGYDFKMDIDIDLYGQDVVTDKFRKNSPVHWEYETESEELKIYSASDTVVFKPSFRMLRQKVVADKSGFVNDASSMIARAEGRQLKSMLFINSVSLNQEDSLKSFSSFHGIALLKYH